MNIRAEQNTIIAFVQHGLKVSLYSMEVSLCNKVLFCVHFAHTSYSLTEVCYFDNSLAVCVRVCNMVIL